MTKQLTTSLNNDYYLITPSLLNAWAFIEQSVEYLRESENYVICYEDKCDEWREEAYNDYLKG